MKYAKVLEMEMSIQEFSEKTEYFRKNPGPMSCIECGAAVSAKAITSMEVVGYFSHPPKPATVRDLDDCSRAARSHRLRWFGEEDRNAAEGQRVRREFFDEVAVKTAYAFCLSFVGTGNLPLAKFQEMIDRADRLDIWSYTGMDIWCIPHILLLLADFGVGTERPCHFALVQTSKLSAIWYDARPVLIKKLFSDTGRQAKMIGGQPSPRPILKSDTVGVDTSWIRPGLENGLIAFAHRQRS